MGFGTGWGGTTGWGGALSDGQPVLYETLTLGENLDVWLPLWVKHTTPTSPFLLTVEFSHALDGGYAPNFLPSNYAILPALNVVTVSFPTPTTVRLQTEEQQPTVYTLVVGDGRSATGDTLDPARNSVLFAGFAVAPNYFATAQSEEKVMLTFATAPDQNAALTDASSYTIEDLNGNPITVDSAVVTSNPFGAANNVTLELGTDLDPGGYYVITLSSLIKTIGGLTYNPLTDVFQYIDRDLDNKAINISLGDFSGEVTNLAYPDPQNQAEFPEELDNAYWSQTLGTILPNAINGPPEEYSEGRRADGFVEDTSTGWRRAVEKTLFLSSERYTFSVFAKRGSRSWVQLAMSNMPGGWSGWNHVWYDLENGVVGSSTFDASVDPEYGIEDVGNGWYWCWVTADLSYASRLYTIAPTLGDYESNNYTGDGQKALYLFGVQLAKEQLLGRPLGQVFFSPNLDSALPVSPASSTIQVDSVSVCTRAYDVYEIPEIPDPQPLMTYGATLPYNSSVLNNPDDVVWATADRLGLAHVNLTDRPEDTWGGATDGPADATLQETFDQSRVALLNVDDWVLYDGVGTPFICADNLTPIPAGTTTNINLQP